MNRMMVGYLIKKCGDKNLEMDIAKKMGLSIVTMDGLQQYDMLATVVFNSEKKKHTKKVILDNSLDSRHKKFYLACLISKMLLSNAKGEKAIVIGHKSKFSESTIALTKTILGREMEVDDIIEEHNPTVKPRQYIKIN